MPRDRSDKVPELIQAARRARDDHTALLLLQKAKEIDPTNVLVYRLRAEIFERRGDDDRLRAELGAALDVDPTNWDVRWQLLNFEYPRTKNLEQAAGVVRDLVWERGYPARLFNASRESLRSENELSYDEALLGHLAYAGREGGYDPIEPDGVEIAPGGEVVVLVSSEPWLLRFAADGALRFGIDLWLEDEGKGIERPADVAVAPDGSALLADPYGRCLRRFDPEGRYAGALAAGGGGLEAEAIAVAPPSGDVVALTADGGLRRLDPKGKARGPAAPLLGPDGTAFPSARGFGLAIAPDGTAYAVDPGGSWVAVYGPRARRPDGHVALVSPAPSRARPGPERKGAAGKRGPRGENRRGFAYDAGTGAWLVADAGRGFIARHDVRTGAFVERIALPAGLRPLRRPRDVAATERSEIAIADTGNERVLFRDAAGAWAVRFALPEAS